MEKSSDKSSKISGFYKLRPEERLKIVTEYQVSRKKKHQASVPQALSHLMLQTGW